MRRAFIRHSSSAISAQSSVVIMCERKIAAALSASAFQRFLSPATQSHSAAINSGRKAIASASPTANRAYTSVSRYAASTYSVEAAAAARPPPNMRLAAAYMPAAAPMFRLMSSMLPT